MRRVVDHVAPRVPVHPFEEHLEGRAVEQVLARMDLVADVDAGLVRGVEQRPPAPRQLVECGIDQPRRPLRPRIDERPGQCAREGRHRRQAHASGRLDRQAHLFVRPLLPRLRVAPHLRRGESVEHRVVGRMDGDELPLQMGRELGDLDPVGPRHAHELVAIVLRRRRLLEVDQPAVPGRHLHAEVAKPGGPLGDRVPRVERRRVAGELRQETAPAPSSSSRIRPPRPGFSPFLGQERRRRNPGRTGRHIW